MSGAAQPSTRPILAVLLNALGLAVWAAHFGAIYAVNALACERDLALRPLGLPFVPAAVIGLTLLAVLALALILRRAVRRLAPPHDEGGEEEPRFTTWFAAATAALAALAVLFQAAPALVVPSCG
jgi:hypothetical protein